MKVKRLVWISDLWQSILHTAKKIHKIFILLKRGTVLGTVFI
ncbi:hypothetical protein [Campylobacter iguaniorum]|nr:hypothetical protein [Campylobacter iguaniorum]